jgi:hypothetical protein
MTMRFAPNSGAFLLLFCLSAIPAAVAQRPQSAPDAASRWAHSDSRQVSPPPQSLTPDERLTILGTALDLHRYPKQGSDCTHFIHALYERAGFPYAYANSSDLYEGTDEFRRVNFPQAGDLVVWRGHAGIVTNPAHHSFFSLLSSGPAVNTYDSPYWRRRGRPRFFRYVKSEFGVRSSSLRNDF